jgi:serine/threonine protein kinase/TPR repeat protein
MAETTQFDHYVVATRDDGSLYELGRGAMGITYKAFDTNLRCDVALKVINGAYLDSEVACKRFVREARAAAQLRNRHVASIFHLGVKDDAYFYAMEFIDGKSVDSLVRKKGPLPVRQALQITDQVARALTAAQKHNLVHRDIKPSNLMLVQEDDDVVVKVIDFGLAKSMLKEDIEDVIAPKPGEFVGTPYYASPEQLRGEELDTRSDIYSLGVTLWFMLTGHPPFRGTIDEIVQQHMHQPPPWPEVAHLPQEVTALLKTTLEKNRSLRPTTPASLRAILEVCLSGLQPLPEKNVAKPAAAEPSAETAALGSVSADGFKRVPVAGERFQILACLGEGNVGKIFEARDLVANQPVRLILINESLMESPDLLTQLNSELELLKTAEHPNLLRVFSLEKRDDTGFVAYEWTDGFSLLDMLRSRRELPANEALLLLKQAAEGVDHAIAHGIKRLDLALHQMMVHFHGKPDSETRGRLMEDAVQRWPAFTLKLNPLGMQQELSKSETWAGGQTIVGGITTPHDFKGPDLKSKYVQALGALAYELLGGTLSPLMLGQGIVHPPPRYIPLSNLSEEGNKILKRAMNPSPAFARGREFFEALNRTEATDSAAREARSVVTRVKAAPQGTPSLLQPLLVAPGKKRRLLPYALAATALFLAAGALVALKMRPEFFHLSSGENAEATLPAVGELTAPAPLELPAVEKREEAPVAENKPEPTQVAALQPSKSLVPEPTAQDRLKESVAIAEAYEASQNWYYALSEYVRIGRDFPDSDIGPIRMEMILERLHASPGALTNGDFKTLRQPIEQAAEQGVITAMMILGENLRKSDPTTAFRWFSTAAAKDHAAAMTQVGLMYSNGAGVERDLGRAVKWFQRASEKGDAAGKTCLAECYLNGKGIARNPTRAVEILEEAVASGYPRAMDLLGTCYHRGIGTQVRFAEAFRLFSQAQELGYWDSAGNLGVLHMNGDGVPQDAKRAVELFQEGSRNGSAHSMYLYARCLETGTGVRMNMSMARTWYAKSASLGDPQAIKWLKANRLQTSAE